MSSENHCTDASAHLFIILSRFHQMLFNLFEEIEQESCRHKSLICNLHNMQSNILSMRDQKQDTSSPQSSTDKNQEVVIPELEETNKLLSRCRNIRKKFHHSECTANELSAGGVLLYQGETEKDGPSVQKLPPTDCGKTAVRLVKKRSKKSAVAGVISESDFQHLSSLLNQENDGSASVFPSPPLQNGWESNSTGSSEVHLLEKNKKLKSLLIPYLNEEHSGSSLQFLKNFEGTMCQGCMNLLQKNSEAENCTPEFKGCDEAGGTGIFYSDAKDVLSVCQLFSEVQFSNFYYLVKNYIQEIISSGMTSKHKERGSQIPGLKCLLELGSSELTE